MKTELRGVIPIGIPLPKIGTWTASSVASILKMRIKNALLGVLIGNMMAGAIVPALALHII